MIKNIGYLAWKSRIVAREQTDLAEGAQAAAEVADAAAGTAQITADDALELASVADTKAESANAATGAISEAAGQCAMPVFQWAGPGQYALSCSTSGASIQYRINGGSWTAYAGAFAHPPAAILEAYATAGGFTDSEITEYAT